MRLTLHAAVGPVGYPTLGGRRAPGIPHILLILATTAFGAWPLQAQSIVDGQRVEFTPSPDNDTVVGGVAVVQNYSLNVYVSGSSTITATADLGKPTPDSDGFMRVPFVPLLTAPLQVGVIYEARVSANGPGGSAASAVSNTFMVTSSCGTATISPATVSVGPGTATGSVNVTSSCAWSALSNVSWISATSGSPGTGSGVLGYSVDANTTLSARSGTITIAGNTLTVNQAAACSYVVSPATVTDSFAAITGTITVTTSAGCGWTSSGSAPWLTLTGAGSGSGTATFALSANLQTTIRTATVTVAGQQITVTQTAAAPPIPPLNLRIIR